MGIGHSLSLLDFHSLVELCLQLTTFQLSILRERSHDCHMTQGGEGAYGVVGVTWDGDVHGESVRHITAHSVGRTQAIKDLMTLT